MKRSHLLALVNGVYWLMLALWFGSLVFTGAIAAMLFPMMKRIDLILPDYAAYDGSHSILLAGRIMAVIFSMQDVVELAAMVVLAMILMLHFSAFRMPLRRASNVVRVLAAATLMILVSYDTFVLAPRMTANLDTFWRTAEAGEIETARQAKAAFDADHPGASRVMSFTALMLMTMIFASAAALSAPAEAAPVSTTARRGPQLEEPELLRRMNR